MNELLPIIRRFRRPLVPVDEQRAASVPLAAAPDATQPSENAEAGKMPAARCDEAPVRLMEAAGSEKAKADAHVS